MGRELRTFDRDGIYHVISRGSGRGPIVWDTVDQRSFVRALARAATRYRWRVVAWCLMTTHYHVLLQAPEGGISEGMQQINSSHSRRTNLRHDVLGRHLFLNRFFSAEVSTDAHLVGATLYIARNPVAAGLCTRAHEWTFGSYRATVGLDKPPDWLAVDRALQPFGSSVDEFARVVHNGHLLVSDTMDPPGPPNL
ncbi:MAG: REP-associated tyrosine transposase [Gaiellaceae bacterium]|nr:REP-associated tyrosine transposase [Gaiellaceae bacterium]